MAKKSKAKAAVSEVDFLETENEAKTEKTEKKTKRKYTKHNTKTRSSVAIALNKRTTVLVDAKWLRKQLLNEFTSL